MMPLIIGLILIVAITAFVAWAGYEIGPPAVALTFTDRLARENRWTPDYGARVIREYKRFCYLAVTSGQEVTPSDAVDQAWHLHLTYSRDYWQRFCPDILGTDLHHGPTGGTSDDRTRYYMQYAETLKLYEEAFGEAPPPDIWSDARTRFLIEPKAYRINPAHVIVTKRRWAIVLLVALVTVSFAVGGILGALV